MPLPRLPDRTRIVTLVGFLVVESLLVVSLRRLGWFGTGHAIELVVCVFFVALPLLLTAWLIAGNRFRFSIRSALAAVALVAFFLTVSLTPLVRYRAARSVSMQLLAADATLEDRRWDNNFYTNIGLPPAPLVDVPRRSTVPPWLTPLTKGSSTVPPDRSVRTICFADDRQIRIFADHWERFSALQSVTVLSGVTENGLRVLEKTLPRLAHLERVHTCDVAVPGDWYDSLRNVRTLFVWAEGALAGQPFPAEHLEDIAALPNLEVLMVLGYALDDSDAHTLASSTSLRRLILRRTAVTPVGESRFSDSNLDRIVYRN